MIVNVNLMTEECEGNNSIIQPCFFVLVFLLLGVWHNFVLCVAALAVLFLLPVFLFPVYSTGSGALVSEVVQVGAACC